MTLAYVLAALTVPLVGLLLLGEKRDAPWRGWAKGAASTGFIATAIAAGAADTTYGAWVLAALCLGWVGDIALVSAQRKWFLLGLGAFLLSHLTYIGAFATVRPHALVAVAGGGGPARPRRAGGPLALAPSGRRHARAGGGLHRGDNRHGRCGRRGRRRGRAGAPPP